MTDSAPPLVWRFRLMLLTATALLVLLVLWVRARADITAVEKRRSAMVGALRGLLAAQDAHEVRTGRYAATTDSLEGWQPPAGLTVQFTSLDATSWSATVHDPTLQLHPTTCGVFVGRPQASPHRAVVEPGVTICW